MDTTDPALVAAARLLLSHVETGSAKSPTWAALWPMYWESEAKFLRSAIRTESSWRTVKDAPGADGVIFQDREILSTTSEHIEGVREWMKVSPLSKRETKPATRNRALIVLRRFMHWAHEQRHIPYVPVPTITLEPERNVRHVRVRSEADLEALLEHCHPVVRVLVLVLYDTGMRRGEALDLRRDQVVPCLGMGAVIELAGDDTKTDSARQVPLTRRAYEALQSLPHRGPYYFANEKGERYHERYIYELFCRARAAAGIPEVRGEKLRIHDLRHTFAYERRATDGWPQSLVMMVMGHKTTSSHVRYGIGDRTEMLRGQAGVEQRLQATRKGPQRVENPAITAPLTVGKSRY